MAVVLSERKDSNILFSRGSRGREIVENAEKWRKGADRRIFTTCGKVWEFFTEKGRLSVVHSFSVEKYVNYVETQRL